jgi:hypothetical protein
MACKTGLPFGTTLLGFTLPALPAVLTALLALAISIAPYCLYPGRKTTMLWSCAIRLRGLAFAFCLSILSGFANRISQPRHGSVTKWCVDPDVL